MNKTNKIIFSIISSVFLIAIFTCLIVDKAISGTLSWSIIPIASIIFVYLLIIPFIYLKKNKVLFSLILLTLLIIPYMYVLNVFINSDTFLDLSIKASIVGLIYFWILFVLFKVLKNKLLVTAIAFLLAVPTYLFINSMVPGSYIDVWSIISLGMLLFTSISCFIFDYLIKGITKK